MAESADADTAVVSRVEQVYRVLRQDIIEGALAPGSPLRLHELAAHHGVSLIPVREALRLLEMERLVDTTPNKGARVAEFSVEDVVDAYAIRVLLEAEALKQGWDRLAAGAVDDLRKLRAELLAAYQRNDRERATTVHRRLHFALYEASGSGWLNHLIGILWSHTERYRRLVLTLRTSFDEATDLHGRIIDALESGDRAAGVRALRADLRRTERLVVAHYRKDTPGPPGA